ncbi:MAG: outer membrane protein multidrug efflux system, partial [Candidatus Hydrogenedentes bacterium]|nr:outer membrane protein multidrug efflux system [Candidatus Hydrogenedentota bacterium]
MKPTALLLALLLSGCTLAPRYERPGDLTPEAFRGAESVAPSGPSFGELDWWQVFNDEALQTLIRQGIENNYDIRIAAQRVIEAQAQATSARAGLFPSITGNAQAEKKERFQLGSTPLSPPSDTKVSGIASSDSAASLAKSSQQASARDPSAGSQSVSTALNLAWELDFWGRVRSADKSARAQLLATEAGRQAVIQSVVTGIAQAYLGLREYDMELSIAKSTLESRQKSLKLVQARKEWGVGSQLDVRQSEALVAAAAVKIPDLEAKIAQQENQIGILIGANPGDIPRGGTLDQQQMTVEVPAGLPSALLDRRPDIRQAEQSLIAANADVGEARAAFFPQITLTAALGTISPAMAGVFEGPAGTTSVAPTAAW